MSFAVYPIGTPGKPWGTEERNVWRSKQTKKRDFVTDVVSALKTMREKDAALAQCTEVVEYGTLDYTHLGLGTYTLVAVKSKDWSSNLPSALVTGGVHGYETSGVHGALKFIAEKFVTYVGRVNLLVLPCITPWAYETINRWNPEAIDPNRSFNPAAPGCGEARFAMELIEKTIGAAGPLVHVDCHETTDTDNSEFSPAKFARDGTAPDPWEAIPDGFYLVGDSVNPQLEFHEAMIRGVKTVTHIAPPDEKNTIIGEPLVKEGVILIPVKKLSLCGGHTAAPYVTTTEVYPDSAKTNPDECNRAQVACVSSAIDFVLTRA
jgi:hypothetical protein